MSITIDETKLVPNSGVSKAKEPEKRVEKPVVSSEVKTKKKSLPKRIVEAFIGDEAVDIKGYLLFDVLIPAVKNTTSDLITTGINMALFGDSRRPERISRNGQKSSYKSYDSIYSSRNERKSYASYNRRAAHEFDDIIFESRFDAEEVLSHLGDLIEIYETATVADLYDLIGRTGSYTDRGWGWKHLRGANVRQVRDGYILELPRAEVL